MNSRNIFTIIIAGLLLSTFTTVMMLSTYTPKIWGPFPLPLFTIYFFSGESILTLFITPAIAFWIWDIQLFQGKGTIPLRSIVALVAAIGLSIAYFFTGGSGGLEFQGLLYTLGVSVLSGVLIIVLIYLLFICRKKPSFTRSLLFHVIAMFWFFSYAFPYFGELL